MTIAGIDRLRCAAGAAAVVLAALSRGDALVLAVVVGVAAWRLPAVAVLPALLASSWRWGSTSLEALAGAQAVLGPAGWVGPRSAATASVLAALAVVLLLPVPIPLAIPTPPPEVGGVGAGGRGPGAPNLVRLAAILVAAAAGISAGAIVAGPAAGGGLWIRVVAGVVGTTIAVSVGRLRRRIVRIGWVLDVAGIAAAGGALLAASLDAPGWAGTVDGSAAGEGTLVAAAVVTLTIVGLAARDAMGNRRP